MIFRIAATCIIAGTLALASISAAMAQQDDRYPNAPSAGGGATGMVGPGDDYVMRLIEERTRGFIYIDAAVAGQPCASVRIIIARNVEGRWHPTVIAAANTFLGARTGNGGTAMLEPGDYTLTHVLCTNYGSRQLLIGPFARFRVNGGEVLNLGTLTLYLGRGSTPGKLAITGKSIGGMRAEARAAFRQQNPRTAARMVDRYMSPLGAVAGGGIPAAPKVPSSEFLKENSGGQTFGDEAQQ